MLQVFIVGAPRTGTSLLLHAIKTVFKLPGQGESHVMPLFQRLIHWERTYLKELEKGPQTLLIRSLPAAELEQVIFDFARSFYGSQFPSGSWVDKTPTGEAVHGIALINRIFPDAKIIATKRNGIEVVSSHAKKFNVSISEACTAWLSAIQGIIAYQNNKNVLVVDPFDFVMNSRVVANAICAHLGQQEKIDDLANYLRDERVESTTDRDWTRRHTLDDVDWTEKDKAYFTDKCGPAMQKLGYDLNR